MSVDSVPSAVLWNIMQKPFVTMVSLVLDTDTRSQRTNIKKSAMYVLSAHDALTKVNGFCWHNMNIIVKEKYEFKKWIKDGWERSLLINILGK